MAVRTKAHDENSPEGVGPWNQTVVRVIVAGLGAHILQDILILIVEDEPLIRLDLEHALQDGGYRTLAEVSGEAAMATLETERQTRALVTDINLKGEATGWDVARRARELIPDLPVIYVTSVAALEWTSQGVPKSVLIQKPFAPAQIITAVSMLLNAGESGQGPNSG